MNELIYKEGFDFSFDPKMCSQCSGNCCIGESGYIWISPAEVEALALFLNMNTQELINRYLFKVGYKYSIKEIKLDPNNYICCFFDLNKKQCSIYDARPNQCRTFPFWEHFKKNKHEVLQECPAVQDI